MELLDECTSVVGVDARSIVIGVIRIRLSYWGFTHLFLNLLMPAGVADHYALPVAAITTAGLAVVSYFVYHRFRNQKLTSAKKVSAGAVEIPDDDAHKIYIYFASQTGTAEGFANELSEEAQEMGLHTEVIDFEEFDPDTFVEHKNVIIVAATYGEGDPTDNASEFANWLSKDAQSGCLADMK